MSDLKAPTYGDSYRTVMVRFKGEFIGPRWSDLRGKLSDRDGPINKGSVFAGRWLQGFQRLSSRALAMTLTELSAMAAPAIMGLR